jgi:hypothetical protein
LLGVGTVRGNRAGCKTLADAVANIKPDGFFVQVLEVRSKRGENQAAQSPQLFMRPFLLY